MSELHVGLGALQKDLSQLSVERDNAAAKATSLAADRDHMMIERDGFEEQLSAADYKISSLQERCTQHALEVSSLRAVQEGLRANCELPESNWATEFGRVQRESEMEKQVRSFALDSGTKVQELAVAEERIETACEEATRIATAELRAHQEQERAEFSAELSRVRGELRLLHEQELWQKSDIASNLLDHEASQLCGEVKKWGEAEVKKANQRRIQEVEMVRRKYEGKVGELNSTLHEAKAEGLRHAVQVQQLQEEASRWRMGEAKLGQLLQRQDSSDTMASVLREELQQAQVEKSELAAQLKIAVAAGGKVVARRAVRSTGVWGKPLSPSQWMNTLKATEGSPGAS